MSLYVVCVAGEPPVSARGRFPPSRTWRIASAGVYRCGSGPACCAQNLMHSEIAATPIPWPAQTTPSTCAQTAIVAKNKVMEASASASSSTVRNMIGLPYPE